MDPSEYDQLVLRSARRVRRDRFLTLAIAFEGGLALISMALGMWTGIHPLERFAFEWEPALQGVALALPLFALFLVFFRYPIGPLRQIRQALMDALGPELALCRWWELAILAVVTGFSEELLFRGVLQTWIGLYWSNLIFGLVHWVTPLYAILAGAIGLLLGWSLEGGIGQLTHGTVYKNLATPILTHTVYDFLAFLVIANAARKVIPAQEEIPVEPT